jgi:hypothetical protein
MKSSKIDKKGPKRAVQEAYVRQTTYSNLHTMNRTLLIEAIGSLWLA